MKFSNLLFFILLSAFLTSCIKDETPIDPCSQDQINKELANLDAYFDKNNVPTTTKHNSGLQYVVHTNGTGSSPIRTSLMDVDYKLYDLQNTTIDDGTNFKFDLSQMINAWQIGLPLLKEGDVATLYSPSCLAYGSSQVGNLPAYATLIFDVTINEVLNVDENACSEIQKTHETGKIENHLEANPIAGMIVHESGLQYAILTEGNGAMPTVDDEVIVDYIVHDLKDKKIDEDTDKTLKISALIEAWQIVLPLLKEGSTATFYAPSCLAYGAFGTSNIAPYAPLKFQVTFKSIVP